MFSLLSTTFLELAAFLIIVYLIFTFWEKWNSKYKLTAIISLLITGIFFINDLTTIMASIKPTEASTQKIVISSIPHRHVQTQEQKPKNNHSTINTF